MLQTILIFSNTPNNQKLLKALQEYFPVEVKLSSGNCIDINHGVVNCSLSLSDKEIVISTTKEGVSIKKLLFNISVGLVGAVAFFLATGFKFRSSSELVISIAAFVVGILVVTSMQSTFPGQPSKVKLHNVVVDYLKEEHGGQD